jgi:hypothetical protein
MGQPLKKGVTKAKGQVSQALYLWAMERKKPLNIVLWFERVRPL